MSQLLDQYIHRFENLPPFNVHHLTPDGMDAKPWLDVDMDALSRELIFDELNPMVQVDTVPADIAKWGRLEAMTLRVWQLRERQLRTWKAIFVVKLSEESEKRVPEWLTKEKYRTEEKYTTLSVEIERAEEAYNVCRNIVQAFKAKKDILERFARYGA